MPTKRKTTTKSAASKAKKAPPKRKQEDQPAEESKVEESTQNNNNNNEDKKAEEEVSAQSTRPAKKAKVVKVNTGSCKTNDFRQQQQKQRELLNLKRNCEKLYIALMFILTYFRTGRTWMWLALS